MELRFWRNKTQKYDDKVNKLVPVADILAVTSFTNFLTTYKELEKVDPKEWDFFVTIAGISIGLTGLANKIKDDSEYDRLTELLSSQITKWNEHGEFALTNLMTYIAKHQNYMEKLPPDEATKYWAAVIGFWCFANIGLDVPKDKPSNFMSELGMLLIISFYNWWE